MITSNDGRLEITYDYHPNDPDRKHTQYFWDGQLLRDYFGWPCSNDMEAVDRAGYFVDFYNKTGVIADYMGTSKNIRGVIGDYIGGDFFYIEIFNWMGYSHKFYDGNSCQLDIMHIVGGGDSPRKYTTIYGGRFSSFEQLLKKLLLQIETCKMNNTRKEVNT